VEGESSEKVERPVKGGFFFETSYVLTAVGVRKHTFKHAQSSRFQSKKSHELHGRRRGGERGGLRRGERGMRKKGATTK